ncbi:hypothetical protein SJ05684_c21200 [Sinorhizobium sojae CCBAU 05684]|uniref:Uncharacterized protein n=1 Tax=Sinorhizobium sojae CCBAU 05684 TaxID=716928 RepID=A0A249PCB6_9HYPH|nr:hypothetical protein SJ05684_c21200 [Sinorhizobium sojae CCBAU 05684]
MRINRREGLIDRSCSSHGLTSEVGQHVFYHYEDQHFILDNEDLTTGKQSIHHEPCLQGN